MKMKLLVSILIALPMSSKAETDFEKLNRCLIWSGLNRQFAEGRDNGVPIEQAVDALNSHEYASAAENKFFLKTMLSVYTTSETSDEIAVSAFESCMNEYED
jgi:hypothetical protein